MRSKNIATRAMKRLMQLCMLLSCHQWAVQRTAERTPSPTLAAQLLVLVLSAATLLASGGAMAQATTGQAVTQVWGKIHGSDNVLSSYPRTGTDSHPAVAITPDGLWQSNTATPSLASGYNDLLAFQVGTGTYSTGVDDALLTSNGVSFIANRFRALQTAVNITAGSSTFNAIPKVQQDVPDQAPQAGMQARLLYDGAHGLNLGTAIFNIPPTAVKFDVTLAASQIRPGDTRPHLIVTQVGEPSTNAPDIFYFVRADGSRVGQQVSASFGSQVLPVGRQAWAFYTPSSGVQAYPGTSAQRDLRILTLRLSDFGITASNADQIAGFVQEFSGSSDSSFVAYNEALFRVVTLGLNKTVGMSPMGVDVETNYTLTVTNTGTIANSASIVVTDTIPPGLTIGALPNACAFNPVGSRTVQCTIAVAALDPGQQQNPSIDFLIPVTPTASLQGLSVTNKATATGGGDPNCNGLGACADEETTPIAQPSALSLTKTSLTTGIVAPGDTISYAVTITNSSLGFAARNVSWEDAADSGLEVTAITSQGLPGAGSTFGSCTPSGCTGITLGAGASNQYTVTATVTGASGGIARNAATVTGGSCNGDNRPAVCSDSHENNIFFASPALTIEKTASAPSGNTVGSSIEYSFLVSNTGNVDLTDVSVIDPLLTDAGVTVPPVGNLAAGTNQTVTASYVLTADDFAAGSVANIATASGMSPSNAAVTSPEDSTDTPLTANPALSIEKTAGAPSGNTVGSSIEYSFLVSNTGNVDLTDVSVIDPLLTDAGVTVPPVGNLAAGTNQTVTASYVLTADDFAAGSVANIATASGMSPSGSAVTSLEDSTDTPLTANPALSIEKTAAAPSGNTVGSSIEYSFLVSNTGNVDLSAVTVIDPLLTDAGVTVPAIGDLAAGANQTVTAIYTLTADDFAAGTVANTATASGTSPSDTAVTSPEDSTDTPLTANPALSIEKTAGAPSGNTVGSSIEYSFLVSNTGNVDLSDVAVIDPLLTDAGVTVPAIGDLAAGANQTVTAIYTLTADDFAAGTVANTATATGTSPSDTAVTSPEDSTDTPLTATPSLTFVKTGALEEDGTITYSFSVNNNGNVPLSGVSITDEKLSENPIAVEPADLDVGATGTAIVRGYRATQEERDLGQVENRATVTATPPEGVDPLDPVSSTPDPNNPGRKDLPGKATVVAVAAAPALRFEKTVINQGPYPLGSTVTYQFTVENIGEVSLTDVLITDDLEGLSPIDLIWPSETAGVLKPDQQVTGTASYTVTQADVNHGSIMNKASVQASPLNGSPLTGEDAVTVTTVATPPHPVPVNAPWSLALVALAIVAAASRWTKQAVKR